MKQTLSESADLPWLQALEVELQRSGALTR
jgi:hypothetical protein